MIRLLNGALKLHQSESGLKSTSDAIFLAAGCGAQSDETILDAGCGIGTATLCLKHRLPECQVTGIDIQADHITLARHNASENKSDIIFKTDDVLTMKNVLFDHIICNPPYFDPQHGSVSPQNEKATAKHTNESLDTWLRAMHRLLKAKGTLTIVYRTDRIHDVLNGVHGKFGAIRMFPLWSKRDAPAKIIVLRMIKDSKTPSALLPGIVLHHNDGTFTDDAELILREGKALPITMT